MVDANSSTVFTLGYGLSEFKYDSTSFGQLQFSTTKIIRLKFVAKFNNITTGSGPSTNAIGFSDGTTGFGTVANTSLNAIKIVQSSATASAALYFATSNGSANTNTAISGVTNNIPYLFEIVWTPTVDVKLYVDGVLKVTHTTNIPTGGNADLLYQTVWGGGAGSNPGLGLEFPTFSHTM